MGPGTSGTRLLRHPTHSTELFLGSPINPTCRIIFWPHCGDSINMLTRAFRWIGLELISDILTSAAFISFRAKARTRATSGSLAHYFGAQIMLGGAPGTSDPKADGQVIVHAPDLD